MKIFIIKLKKGWIKKRKRENQELHLYSEQYRKKMQSGLKRPLK